MSDGGGAGVVAQTRIHSTVKHVCHGRNLVLLPADLLVRVRTLQCGTPGVVAPLAVLKGYVAAGGESACALDRTRTDPVCTARWELRGISVMPLDGGEGHARRRRVSCLALLPKEGCVCRRVRRSLTSHRCTVAQSLVEAFRVTIDFRGTDSLVLALFSFEKAAADVATSTCRRPAFRASILRAS
ncbi:hypothetical protein HPB51_019562 [Rhipicephalus microplus]|uniref:Uncharacterized protein n=1 Tax=Rhipicephalus microplus TaxID=6941 RepID=A0A9J6DVS1_RHIMP|nr:hypothetical protein HPB51_019562 [Rhipicephalus microplus]